MKKKILLIDDSLTVQKVVALTLDKSLYELHYAKDRVAAMQSLHDIRPDLVLLSEHIQEIDVPSFPKEVEAKMGREWPPPPFILISTQDAKPMKNYALVIKKPFSPMELQKSIQELIPQESVSPIAATPSKFQAPQEFSSQMQEDHEFQKSFNSAFADEVQLTNETLQSFNALREASKESRPQKPSALEDLWNERPRTNFAPSSSPNVSELWKQPVSRTSETLLGSSESMVYKATLENRVEEHLGTIDFKDAVQEALNKILPPIVERIVQERIESLLNESERFMDTHEQ